MAQIIPNSPISTLPAEVLKVYRFFKSLPDEYLVWHHVTPWEREAPDFMIINPAQKAVLIKVSSATALTKPSAAQMLLLEESQMLGAAEMRILENFRQRIPAALHDHISLGIIFPNIRSIDLDMRAHAPPKYHWIGQEKVQAHAVDFWNGIFRGASLDASLLDLLRSHFTPEARVPASLTVRSPIVGRHEAALQGYLLDIDQESAVKNDLYLPAAQDKAARDIRIGIVNGVPGSGKTLILLYRLRLLHSMFQNQRFLVLTHNRPLIRDIRAKYGVVTGARPRNIYWRTFLAFCRGLWPNGEPWPKLVGIAERERLAASIWERHANGSTIQPESFISEIDWIKDQLPMDREKYLNAERKGRGFGLSRDQRLRMWDAMVEYQKLLKARGQMDWGDVPRRIWKYIQDKKVQLPEYEFVMIDEAQFFAPIWFDIVRRIVRPKTGSLFIVADPAQGFLGRGASWKSLGVEARGKTQNLRRSYRTTFEILSFANSFYQQRLGSSDGDDDIVEPDLRSMPKGVPPFILPVRSPQDEVGKVTAEVEAIRKEGVSLRNILILHAEWDGVGALIASLRSRLGEGSAYDPKDLEHGDGVRVTSLNAGTGLESPIVFLVGLNRLLEREQSLRLSEGEATRLVVENTRKIYMAATRAGQRLVITYVGAIPETLLASLKNGFEAN